MSIVWVCLKMGQPQFRAIGETDDAPVELGFPSTFLTTTQHINQKKRFQLPHSNLLTQHIQNRKTVTVSAEFRPVAAKKALMMAGLAWEA